MNYPSMKPIFRMADAGKDDIIYQSCVTRAKLNSSWHNKSIAGPFDFVHSKFVELEHEACRIYHQLTAKRKIRKVKGQWMQITDRREQYYRNRQVYEERMDLLAKAYGVSR